MNYLASSQFIDSLIISAITIAVICFIGYLIKIHLSSKSNTESRYLIVMNIWRIVRMVIILIAVFEVLTINGIHIGRYVAGLGIASAIAGFALQDPIKDIIMGITIIFEGYFKLGDVIEYNGKLGKVVAFNIKTTWIFMLEDEKTLIVANRNMYEVARASDWFDVDIPIGYNVDLHLSRALCREAAKRIERLRYVYSCDFINTQELAESWINYRLRIHCLPEKKYLVRRNANAVIQDVFYEHKVEFPLSIKVIYNGDNDKDNSELYLTETEGSVIELKEKKKADYELGRGAAKSKVCVIDGSSQAVVKAIDEAERYVVAENLDSKMKTRIRLLSEETLSMTQALTDISSGEFYIERDGADYEICFDAVASVGADAHDKLVSVSTSGTNEAYGGISGIIKKAVDSMIMKNRGDSGSEEDTVMGRSIVKADDDLRWSFNNYSENQKSDTNAEKGDADEALSNNLEMSVLSRFADDVKIAVRANHVNIRILVKSDEE